MCFQILPGYPVRSGDAKLNPCGSCDIYQPVLPDPLTCVAAVTSTSTWLPDRLTRVASYVYQPILPDRLTRVASYRYPPARVTRPTDPCCQLYPPAHVARPTDPCCSLYLPAHVARPTDPWCQIQLLTRVASYIYHPILPDRLTRVARPTDPCCQLYLPAHVARPTDPCCQVVEDGDADDGVAAGGAERHGQTGAGDRLVPPAGPDGAQAAALVHTHLAGTGWRGAVS